MHICSEKYFAQEIKFSINVFAENGHCITVLEKVTKEKGNKNDKIVKLPWELPKFGSKLRKEL